MLEKLQKIGFTEKESQVYLELARKGRLSANQVARNIGIHRTVSYNVLQQLVEKGYVNYITQNKKRIFSISDPNSLLSEIKEKEAIAKDVMMDIASLKSTPGQNNRVEVFEGKDGMRIIHDELKKAEDMRILNATGLVFEHLKYSAGHFVKDMEKIKRLKMIAVQSMKKTKLADYSFNVRYLPKSAENYATTFIFDGKVIIQILRDKPFLIKIENKEIFEGYSKDFDFMWKLIK